MHGTMNVKLDSPLPLCRATM